MNTKSSNSKSIYAIVVVIILGIIGYFVFKGFKPPEDQSFVIQNQSSSQETEIKSAQILSLLRKIKELDIDTNFFLSSAYLSLYDFTVEVPELDVGRINPFAPIQGYVVSTTTRR